MGEEESRQEPAASARAPGPRFAELYAAHAGDLERLCARLLADPEAARDATQESFIRAGLAFRDYDPRRPFRAWLLAIGAHHCIDQLRRRGVEARLFQEADPDELVADAAQGALAHLLQQESRGTLLAAIDALPLRYRAPLVLRYLADFDYAAIAEELQVSRNQVATLLHRGRRRLRASLDAGGREGT